MRKRMGLKRDGARGLLPCFLQAPRGLPQLLRQHSRQPDPPAACHDRRQLAVVHRLVGFHALRIKQVALCYRCPHGFHDHLQEHGFKLLSRFLKGSALVPLSFRPKRPVGAEIEGGASNGKVGAAVHQITTSSARRLPELFKASRMAMRDEGFAPTVFTASTMSRSSTPGSKRNMGTVGSSTSISAF